MVTFNWRIMLGHGLNHPELSVHPTIQTVSCGKKTKHFTQKSQTVKTWVVGNRNSMNSLPLKTVSVFPRVFSSLFPVFFWKEKRLVFFWGSRVQSNCNLQRWMQEAGTYLDCYHHHHRKYNNDCDKNFDGKYHHCQYNDCQYNDCQYNDCDIENKHRFPNPDGFVVFCCFCGLNIFFAVHRGVKVHSKKPKSHGAHGFFFSWRPLIKEWT